MTDQELLIARDEGRVIVLPVKPGTTLYRVIDKCRPRFQDCPYCGGYGWSRCPKAGENNDRCFAYVEETNFSVCVMKIGDGIFLTREEAEKEMERINAEPEKRQRRMDRRR